MRSSKLLADRRVYFRAILAAAIAWPLGGCLDLALHPPNLQPTAYDDSICKHVPPSSQVVNYGCIAGTELSLGD
jgi:hypothetical protein